MSKWQNWRTGRASQSQRTFDAVSISLYNLLQLGLFSFPVWRGVPLSDSVILIVLSPVLFGTCWAARAQQFFWQRADLRSPLYVTGLKVAFQCLQCYLQLTLMIGLTMYHIYKIFQLCVFRNLLKWTFQSLIYLVLNVQPVHMMYGETLSHVAVKE